MLQTPRSQNATNHISFRVRPGGGSVGWVIMRA